MVTNTRKVFYATATNQHNAMFLQVVAIVMGCGDTDPHIPKDRFLESADFLKTLKADVDAVLYENAGHSVNDDEICRINAVLARNCNAP